MTSDQNTTSGATELYSHQTDLYNPTHPQYQITSKKFPQLKLRCPVPTDSDALLGLFTDQRNIQYDKSCDGLNNPTAINGLIKQWSTFNQPLERVNGVIEIDDQVVGTCGLGWIGTSKEGKMIGDAGIMLDFDFRGKGYAYEALRIAIDHGFRVLGMDEIHIATRDANVAMKGLMSSKLGFPAGPINDERFGNDWIWKIHWEEWYATVHSRTVN
jgi:RimJ/RimL family protein N-acetyltransferase